MLPRPRTLGIPFARAKSESVACSERGFPPCPGHPNWLRYVSRDEAEFFPESTKPPNADQFRHWAVQSVFTVIMMDSETRGASPRSRGEATVGRRPRRGVPEPLAADPTGPPPPPAPSPPPVPGAIGPPTVERCRRSGIGRHSYMNEYELVRISTKKSTKSTKSRSTP